LERWSALDLSGPELAERRQLGAGDVVSLAPTHWTVVITETHLLDGELVGYAGRVLPCPLGVDARPVDELVTFEPCHIAAHWPAWRYLEMVQRSRAPRGPGRAQPWERNHGGRKMEGVAATFERVRSRSALVRALKLPPHPHHKGQCT